MTTVLTRRCLAALATALALFPALPSAAQETFVPGLVYAVGQKFDKSFNEGAYTGAQRFTQATGVKVLEFQPQSPAQFEQAVGALARRGATDIAVIGFYYATPLAEVASRHPKIRFTIVDAVVDRPNVQSIVFMEQEGSFLAGTLAALASKTGTIGFVGALDIPLIRKFIAGYDQGARHVRPDAKVLVNFVGTTPATFTDPTGGKEVALSQIQRGADVLFAGAGVSNFGVFQAAQEKGALAIGVDSNQNHLHPGTILTSMTKGVDLAVEQAFAQGRAGTWAPGTRALGLAQNGVALAMDEHNRPLLTADMLARVEAARQDIIAGRITVRTAAESP